MIFTNVPNIRKGVARKAPEIVITGWREVYHLKNAYKLLDWHTGDIQKLKMKVYNVTNPVVKNDIPTRIKLSLNMLSYVYGIRELYIAELLEHYDMITESSGRAVFKRVR